MKGVALLEGAARREAEGPRELALSISRERNTGPEAREVPPLRSGPRAFCISHQPVGAPLGMTARLGEEQAQATFALITPRAQLAEGGAEVGDDLRGGERFLAIRRLREAQFGGAAAEPGAEPRGIVEREAAVRRARRRRR